MESLATLLSPKMDRTETMTSSPVMTTSIICPSFSMSSTMTPTTNHNTSNTFGSKEILNNVNELFQGDVYNVNLDTTASENVHVVFELAQKDANGKTLSTPGVEYIKVSNSTFDCEQFMKDKNKAQYSWNQNDYINIMVYTFKKTSNDSETLGISNLPYQVKGYPEIEGLANGKNYPLSKPGNFPYCVSLNAAYIDKSFEGTRYTTDKGNSKGYIYNTADPNATLAHELGHYLGLFHAFSEKTGMKVIPMKPTTMRTPTIAQTRQATIV